MLAICVMKPSSIVQPMETKHPMSARVHPQSAAPFSPMMHCK
jgi:hypothetical protein